MSLVLDYSKVDGLAKKITFKLSNEKGRSELVSFHQAVSYCFDVNAFTVDGNCISPREIFASNKTKNVLIAPITNRDKNSPNFNNLTDSGESRGIKSNQNDVIGVKYSSQDGESKVEIAVISKKRKKSKPLFLRKPSILSKSGSEESFEKSATAYLKQAEGICYSAQIRALEAIE